MSADSTTPTADLAAEYLLGDKPRRTSTTAKRAARATRKQEALAMRLAGASTRVIAARLNVHPSTVYAWVRDAIAAIPQEQAEELRTLELERLDALFFAVYRDALAGDTRAVDACLRIMERRARYLNLDAAPTVGLEQVGSLLDRLVNGEG